MNVLDLFSGIGGFSLGLERAGMRTVAFCEIEPYCRAVLRKRWPFVPIFDDVRKLTAVSLAREWRYGIDVICGGFPCQDISVAGKGAGIDGERSGLWSEYARLIGEVRPSYVIVENVAALLGRGIERVLGDLSEIGYDAEWHVISAADVGANHLRERVWIVAYPMRDGYGRAGTTDTAAFDEERDNSAYREIRGAVSNTLEPSHKDVAYTTGGIRQWPAQGEGGHFAFGGQNVPHPNGARRLEQWRTIAIREELVTAECGSWWFAEPDVGRVANGVPSRVDRLRALGNAVVPQIPEIIGRAIMNAASQARGSGQCSVSASAATDGAEGGTCSPANAAQFGDHGG